VLGISIMYCLLGAGGLMADAKGVGRGRLVVESGKGMLVTADGRRLPQPWLDGRQAYSRVGALAGLTGLAGVGSS
jgi:hypothetical protein